MLSKNTSVVLCVNLCAMCTQQHATATLTPTPPTMQICLLLLLLLLQPVASASASNDARPNIVGTYEERRTCPHFDTLGCFGDVMEKLCESEPGTAPSDTALSKDDGESMWFCCCPAPYIHCDESSMNPICLDAMEKHIGAPMRGQLPSTFKPLHVAQQVREDVWKSDDRCKLYFANPTPYQQCMKNRNGEMRAVERADLNCETLTWQYEVLSDGDPAEFAFNKCPLPTKRASGSDGARRKEPFDGVDRDGESEEYESNVEL